MKTHIRFLALLSLIIIPSILIAQERMDVYLSPKGGFSSVNNTRSITLKDGKKVEPTLNNSLLDMIQRTEDEGSIKIAMYSFSYTPIQDALIEAALEHGVHIKLIMDGIASWSIKAKENFLEKVKSAQNEAKKQNKKFDFQIRLTSPARMESRGRDSTDPKGERIFGLMHHKFGVFYNKNSKIPVHSFGGCGNITWGADLYFSEDRIIFWNNPSIARQFAEEFARVWNEYGIDLTPNCETEPYIPASSHPGEVQIIFNAEPLNEEEYYRIDDAIIKLIHRVNHKEGTIDLLLFNLTHKRISDELLSVASENPGVQIRIVLDQSQLEETEDRQGIMGPYLENKLKETGLKNFQIRYKWRSNTYGWDEEAKKFQHVHMRALLLHHKSMVVNRNKMAIGTYNWSSSSEYRNFENMMFFDGRYAGHQDVIDRLNAEFDAIWASLKKDGPVEDYIGGCQVIEGERGRALKKKILETVQIEGAWDVMKAIEYNIPEARYDASKKRATLEEICKKTRFPKEKVEQLLQSMIDATLLVKHKEKDKDGFYYGLAD